MKTGKILASAALIAALTSSAFAATSTMTLPSRAAMTKAPKIQVVKEETPMVVKSVKTATVTKTANVRKNVKKSTHKAITKAKVVTPIKK